MKIFLALAGLAAFFFIARWLQDKYTEYKYPNKGE